MNAARTKMNMKSDFAVVGCGVLGTSLCRQLLNSPEFGSGIVTAITKTKNRHEQILTDIVINNDTDDTSQKKMERIQLQTAEEIYENVRNNGHKFKDVVFCAPPSAFDDYPAAVEDAITELWEGPSGGGSFVFTSSGGVYEGKEGEIVTEKSPTCDPIQNPRTARILNAEKKCLEKNGAVLRLAGLYTLERGAHNYWMERLEPDENGVRNAKGRADGIVNLLHYDDAANAAMMAVRKKAGGQIYLISDGNPTTRKGICESALKAKRYMGKDMPTFLGDSGDDLGKVYDGSWSNIALEWEPVFAKSFDEFMAAHGEAHGE